LRQAELEMHRAQVRAEVEEQRTPQPAPVAMPESSGAEAPPPAPAPMSVPMAEAQPVLAPVVPARAAPAPSLTEARAALEDSGLQMVETKADRPSVAEPEPAVPLGRPRQERPRHSAEEEALVQVETKH
jgi:hypothetical protein